MFTFLGTAYDENNLNVPFGDTFLQRFRSLSRRGCVHGLGSSPEVSVTELNEGDVSVIRNKILIPALCRNLLRKKRKVWTNTFPT